MKFSLRSNSAHIILFAAVLAVVPMTGYSQKAVQSQAQRDELNYHYSEATEAYKGLNKRGSREAALRAAGNLYKARRFEEALPFYRYSDSLAMIKDPNELFGYFECLKSAKRYADADELVRTHLSDFGTMREFALQSDRLAYYGKLQAFAGAKVELLPMNSSNSDISPTIYNQWLYFVSTRPVTGNKMVHRINMQPYYNVYAVPLGSDMEEVIQPAGSFGQPEKSVTYKNFNGASLPDGLNKSYHDGPIMVTPSGDRIFFSTNWSDKKRLKANKTHFTLNIYYSEKANGVWAEPKPFPHNSFTYTNQHPFYDEKTSTLYYSSNMPGGQGGHDIWKSTFANGNWSTPENLGSGVNTPKSEVFPTLTSDGQLIFSSNGWPGLGGLDQFLLYDTKLDPLNLMTGVNSEADDFGLVFTGAEGGYLVSNRKGGKGDDDIYSFSVDLKKVIKLMIPPKRLVTATLTDAKTGQPISGARVSVSGNFSKTYVTGADGTFLDSVSYDMLDPKVPEVLVKMDQPGYQPKEIRVVRWEEGKPLFDPMVAMDKIPEPVVEAVASNAPEASNASKTNTNRGKGNPAGKGATASASGGVSGKNGSAGAVAGAGGIDSGNASGNTGGLLLSSDRHAVQIHAESENAFTIFFDFDRFGIRKDASEVLAKVAYVLLEEYAAADIVLSGHADSRGSRVYNEQLSKKRVEAARKWLTDRGVNPSRIRTEVLGESKLAVVCNDPLHRRGDDYTCFTSEEHRLSRRVELEIKKITGQN